MNSVPHPDPHDVPTDVRRTTGFADIVWLDLVSPTSRLVGDWLLGAGPTSIFPSASSDFTGSQMNLQPFAAYFLPDGWSVGHSGNVLANWKASGDEAWTPPIGVSVAKVLKPGPLPVRLALAGQYVPIRPDAFGQKWNLQVVVAPVLPKLVHGNLADPGSLRVGLGA